MCVCVCAPSSSGCLLYVYVTTSGLRINTFLKRTDLFQAFFNQEGMDGFIELEGRECLKEGNTYPKTRNLFLETSAKKKKKVNSQVYKLFEVE